jgi:phosphoribosylformylglycinamidine synthase PurS subunit
MQRTACQNKNMNRFRVYITLKPALLDPAGRAIGEALKSIGYSGVKDIRVGKIIDLELENGTLDQVEEMCKKLLANPVIEQYQVVPSS